MKVGTILFQHIIHCKHEGFFPESANGAIGQLGIATFSFTDNGKFFFPWIAVACSRLLVIETESECETGWAWGEIGGPHFISHLVL